MAHREPVSFNCSGSLNYRSFSPGRQVSSALFILAFPASRRGRCAACYQNPVLAQAPGRRGETGTVIQNARRPLRPGAGRGPRFQKKERAKRPLSGTALPDWLSRVRRARVRTAARARCLPCDHQLVGSFMTLTPPTLRTPQNDVSPYSPPYSAVATSPVPQFSGVG